MTVSEESLAWLHCSLLSSFSISIEPRLAKHSPEIINTYCHCMTVCQCVTGDLLWSQHPTSLSHTGPPCQDIIIIGKASCRNPGSHVEPSVCNCVITRWLVKDGYQVVLTDSVSPPLCFCLPGQARPLDIMPFPLKLVTLSNCTRSQSVSQS